MIVILEKLIKTFSDILQSKNRLLAVKWFLSLLKDFLLKTGMRGNPLTLKDCRFKCCRFAVKVFSLVWKWNPLSYKGNIISAIKENKFII